jgi:hypothetical protein
MRIEGKTKHAKQDLPNKNLGARHPIIHYSCFDVDDPPIAEIV